VFAPPRTVLFMPGVTAPAGTAFDLAPDGVNRRGFDIDLPDVRGCRVAPGRR
jgi:hypothetical protein